MIDNNKVFHILKNINHPNTGVNLIQSKMIKNFRVDENNILFDIHLRPQEENLKLFLNTTCHEEITKVFPEANIHINFIKETANDATNPLPQIKNIIAVASGKGGVGKSTISLGLALGLSQLGHKVGLLDADLYGPSMPTMLGLRQERPEIRKVEGKPKMIPISKHGIHSISLGYLLEEDQAVVLRGPRLGGIIKQFVFDCVWPELDFLIIDLPPGTGDIQLTLVQTIAITGAVMVTTPQDVSVADAFKAMNMFKLPNINVPILGVVENMSWFTPAELPENKYYLFGQGGGEKLVKLGAGHLLGQIPIIQSVQEAGDKGQPFILERDHPGRKFVMDMVHQTLDKLAIRRDKGDPTKIVSVS